ncbi:alpha-amylase family glycosyl hydrolase [Microlunatus sp. GCM10028923]|uniref:alpha-amylase family glycosyl hydrolase n=1 Tax=Microlunatus sp. GCM10028923 TaxID=3273400 RepID=UPI0036074803
MRLGRWVSLLLILALVAGWFGAAPAAAEGPSAVTLVGDLQTELGCAKDWDPACPQSELKPTGEPGRWAAEFTLPAGTYAYKVAIDHGWEISWGLNGGPENVPLTIAGEVRLTVRYDDAVHRIGITPLDLPGDHDPGDGGLVGEPARAPGTGQQFYFALTDRFADGDPANNTGGRKPDKLSSGYDPADPNFYHGGDLAGLESKLDYIASLGTTAIWITPPFGNLPVQTVGELSLGSYHGYWTLDLTAIDAHLGTEQGMRRLIKSAHARGIKIYFDIEINTTADVIRYAGGKSDYVPIADDPYTDRQGKVIDIAAIAGSADFPPLDPKTSFPYLPEVPAAQRNAKKPHWLNDPRLYHNRGDSTFTGESVTYGDFFGLDDLMTEHPKVVRGYIDVYRKWIDFGVDGFRIDTVKHVNVEFWQQWSTAIMKHARAIGNDDFFMFGEVFDGDPKNLAPYVRDTELGGVLDFAFAGNAVNFAKGTTARGLAAFFATDDLYTTPHSSAANLETFVSNHDIGRIGQLLGDVDRLKDRDRLAHELMLLSRGQPVLYYGDEQGFTGGGDLWTDVAGRQDLFATQVEAYAQQKLITGEPVGKRDRYDTDGALYADLAALGKLRAEHPALATGAQRERFADDGPGVYAFSRVDRDHRVEHLVALNNAPEPRTVTFRTLTPGGRFSLLYGDAEPVTASADGSVTITVPALATVVLRADRKVAAPETAQSIKVGAPTPGAALAGLAPVAASVDRDRWQETSFGWRVAGAKAWQPLGTSDLTAPSVRHDVGELDPGTLIEYRAVTVDAAGHRSAASSYGSVGFAVDLSVPDPGDGIVTVPGTHNAAMGCASDWQVDCTAARLELGDDGTWSKTFTGIPAGSYEYKIALNNSWEENYGEGGVRDGPNLTYTTSGGPVTIFYDPETHLSRVETS